MNKSRLQIAKPDILAFFSEKAPHVLKVKQIAAYLSQERRGWRLAQRTTVDVFIEFLQKSGKLLPLQLNFPGRQETLYTWGNVPLFEVLQHLRPQCYFSHYTAMRIHGLTEQVPKTIYLTYERSSRSLNSDLTQLAIDQAFHGSPRVTTNEAELGDQRIVLLNGAFTNEQGVVHQVARHGVDENTRVRVTNIERTLIDAVVRPAYCGGIFEVAKAFEEAKGSVSVNALCAMLQKLDFTYPYHQAIGFYLERAGYSQRALHLVRRFPMVFDFYLTHDMRETRYISDWRIHVPKSF